LSAFFLQAEGGIRGDKPDREEPTDGRLVFPMPFFRDLAVARGWVAERFRDVAALCG
jgi:hypothetical protein